MDSRSIEGSGDGEEANQDSEAVPSTSSPPGATQQALGPLSSIPKHLNRRCSVEKLPAVQASYSKGQLV
ncbi:hypothetical protein B9Z55_016220 [Caenorhabditis nigoni]|uniref:Uncharacterized protein n=1 Tax=Caenorhabditis nigoni TaxID=1611254 RepID=A0A2G5UDP6_9PELO|nr:hypothetical protein B9Z55_016220 [Caenorhabditis nigoni]